MSIKLGVKLGVFLELPAAAADLPQPQRPSSIERPSTSNALSKVTAVAPKTTRMTG